MRNVSSKKNISLGLLGTLAALLAVTVFYQPTNESISTNGHEGSRNVASISEKVGRRTMTMSLLDLPCSEQDQFISGTDLLRIRKPNCGKLKSQLVKSAIRNDSNGYVATVFQMHEGGFTTDYIQLQPGVNQLEIENEFSDGSVEKRLLKIQR